MRPLLLLALFPLLLFAKRTEEEQALRDSVRAVKKAEREARPVRVFAVPDVSSNPTFGTGGGAMVLMTYPVSKTDTISPKSSLFLKGSYYNTHSYIFLLGTRMFFNEDKIRVPFALGRVRVNTDYNYTFDTSGVEFPVDLSYEGTNNFAYVGFNYNVWQRLYVGVDYMYSSFVNDEISLVIGDSISVPDTLIPQFVDLSDTRQSGVFLNAEWDSRDNQFNPLKGASSTIQLGLFPEWLGSTNSFQTLNYHYSYYHSFKPNHTLAGQVVGANTFGDVRGNNMVTLGAGKSGGIRGYETGKYRGRHVFQTQVEYRWYFYKKFGLVGFGGLAKFYGPDDNLSYDGVLPSWGGGLRFMLSEKQRISLRLDYAWGKNGETGFYLGLAEAF